MIAPEIEKHEEDLEKNPDTKGKVSFVKVNVDLLYELAKKLKIAAMPTFLFYSGGSQVKTVVGADLNALKNRISDILADPNLPALVDEAEDEEVNEDTAEEVAVESTEDGAAENTE